MAGALMASGAASSTTVTLDSLIPGGSIIVDDKLFDNFFFSKTGIGTPADSTGINVTDLLPPPWPGLQFSGPFLATAGQTEDFVISFDVTALDPTKLLHDVELLFNGAVTGDGFTNTVENVTNL